MISTSYTLFTEIPLYRNAHNQIFCDPLWAKDIRLHMSYISKFSLCCPVIESEARVEHQNISDLNIMNIYTLAPSVGFVSAFKNLIPNFWRVWNAIQHTQIAHSSGAGWPFPATFYLVFIRLFKKFKWVIVIESSFWMISSKDKITFRRWLSHHMHRFLLGVALKKADARIFTQSFYRSYFLGKDTSNTLINPASWVDENNFISETALKKKLVKDKLLKVIFPTRLIPEKGVHLVLDAIAFLKSWNTLAEITIMGTGELEFLCKEQCKQQQEPLKLIFREPLPYDQQFFHALQAYDIVLVANLKEEQPRIIFDAFSQGVGVIAPRTSGILDITDTENTIYFEPGNAESLAKAIHSIASNSNQAKTLGLNGWRSANQKTHLKMHETRRIFLEKTLYN